MELENLLADQEMLAKQMAVVSLKSESEEALFKCSKKSPPIREKIGFAEEEDDNHQDKRCYCSTPHWTRSNALHWDIVPNLATV